MQYPPKEGKLMTQYDHSWGRHEVLCVRTNKFIKWCLDRGVTRQSKWVD